MTTSKIIIKIGGSIAEDNHVLLDISSALIQLFEQGKRLVLVHGGGKAISRNLKLIDEEPKFIDGLRVTSPQALEMVEMTLSGHVNKQLTGYLNRFGKEKKVQAVGISGVDGSTLICRPLSEDLGCVGSIFKVNPGLIDSLLENGYLPVISPISTGEDDKHYNVNADDAAGAIAGSMQAALMIYLSDVPGVLDQNNKLIPSLKTQEIEPLIEDGMVSGGMIPKLRSCAGLLKKGVEKVLICGWPGRESFVNGVMSGSPAGTVITN